MTRPKWFKDRTWRFYAEELLRDVTKLLFLGILLCPTAGLGQDPVRVVPEIPAWRNVTLTEGATTLQLAGFTQEQVQALFSLRTLTLELRDSLSIEETALRRTEELTRALERQLAGMEAQRHLDQRRIESLERQIEAALTGRGRAETRAHRRRIVPWALTSVGAVVSLVLGVVIVAR